ncbi:MAG: peptide chain release factor N(5)-glutamine methyltransferase [Bacilli bacterium]|nr:peptide chain release factor N(5)-glutamine methyltransferase [Bacilli bacterium]
MNELDKQLLIDKYGSLDVIKDKLDNNYPIQYLIGYVDFYGYKINVDERALIPRYETEGLLEIVINKLKNKANLNILDIGTGTGCIDIVLSKKLNNPNISTIDISSDALELAKENYKLNDVNNVTIINNDIFKYHTDDKYDLIISNPPYVDINEEVSPETKYEPENAIFADNKGLIFYEYIIKESINWIKDEYLIAFEIGYEQGEYLKEYASNYYPNANIEIHKDLSGRDRYLLIYNK